MKQLEWLAKLALAIVVAALCWRPWRRARIALLARARRVLLVRIDHRVGEVLLTTPLAEALRQRGYEVHALVHPKMTRVLEQHPALARAWPCDTSWRRWLGPLAPGLRAVRAERFEAVIDCGNWAVPAVTSSLFARFACPHGVVLGPAQFPSRWLCDVPVAPLPHEPSELEQRAHLTAPLIGDLTAPRLSFREPRATDTERALVAELGAYAVVNPGGRLAERRVPTEVFVTACEVLLEAGLTPLVTWGPGEEPLRDAIRDGCPRARAAPPTTLDGLAFVMKRARVVVCNNTGPMHLSVAVGAPTFALFLGIDMARWGHAYAPHLMLDVTEAVSQGKAAPLVAEALKGHLEALSAPPG